MPAFRPKAQHRNAIAWLLAIAILLAQWVGLMHRIDHAPLQQTHAFASFVAGDDDETDAHHSCVAFDAGAIADTIHVAPFLAHILTNTQVLALWAAFTSWDAPFIPPFSPRAPPRA